MKFYVKVMLIQSVEKTIEIFLWFISISQSVAEIQRFEVFVTLFVNIDTDYE